MTIYSRKALSSVPDFLKCECEKILDGKRANIPLPRSFAEAVLYHGDELFDSQERIEIIKDYKGKVRRVEEMRQHVWETMGDLQCKFDSIFYWQNLSRIVTNPKPDAIRFERAVDAGVRGLQPRIVREEGKQMMEAFGSSQLKTYINGKILELGDSQAILEKLSSNLREYDKLNGIIGSTKKALVILRNFDKFSYRIMRLLRYHYLDPSLLRSFEERRVKTKNVGYQLKNKE
jgi:hypothetical protein